MTLPVLKFMANNEVTLGTANNVNNATLVRIVNPTATVHTVTVKNANGATTLSVFTVMGQSEIVVQKGATDTMAADAGTDLKATSVAFG